MKWCNKRTGAVALILTLALIFSCAFILFLPHTHECVEAECVACALIESSRDMILTAASAAILHQAARMLALLLVSCSDITSTRDATPVGLKVKLSN